MMRKALTLLLIGVLVISSIGLSDLALAQEEEGDGGEGEFESEEGDVEPGAGDVSPEEGGGIPAEQEDNPLFEEPPTTPGGETTEQPPSEGGIALSDEVKAGVAVGTVVTVAAVFVFLMKRGGAAPY